MPSTPIAKAALLLLATLLPSWALAAPGDVLFSDDFESGFGNWTEDAFAGGDASIGTETSSSPNSSMRLRWEGVTATSTVIDTAVAAAELSVWIRRGDDSFSEDPDNGEDLVIQYLDASNNWITLETFAGDGAAGEIINRVYTLTGGALHSGFRLRITLTGGNGQDFDYWHVDDVVISESSPPEPLAFGVCDDFENGFGNWTAAGSGDASIGTETSSSPNSSMRLRWDTVTTTSITIDMDQAIGTLAVWIRRGADAFSENPESGEDLVVEYLNDSNSWVVLESFAGNGTPGEIFNRNYALPADALHSNFQIRFRLLGGSGQDFDYWHVDDVCLEDPTVAAYHMDESAWSGSTGEVEDRTGNGNDGTAVGGATTDNTSPAIPGDPGTCGFGTFDGNDDYVQVANLSNLLNGTASLAFWIRTTQTGNDTGWQAPGVTGVEQAGGTDDIFWGWLDAGGRIGISVGNDFAADQKSASAINDGSWHHVVLTRDAGSGATKVYVDGTLETTGTTASGTIGTSFSSIGRIEDTGGSPEFFDGDLDEVHVFDTVLSDGNVITLRDSTHPCPASGPSICAADFSIHGAGQLDIGDRFTVNGATVTGSGNSVDPDMALRLNASPPLPMFEPAGFPNFTGPDRRVPPGDPTIVAGDYDDIRVSSNRTVNFDTGNGNDFRIQTLQAFNNVTLNLQPGRYFIDELQLGNDVEINIVGGGPVELFIGSELQAGDRLRMNAGGGPGDLLIRMFDGAELQFGNDAEVVGTIYAPGANTEIALGDRANINGGLFSGGEITLGNDVAQIYGQVAETASRLVAQCTATGPDHYAISHDGNGVTCLAENVTITAHAVDHSAVDPGPITITLTTTSGRGDWTAVLNGSGALDNGTAGDGAAAYTFPGSETGVTLAFNHTDIAAGNSESFFFDVTDGTAGDTGNGSLEDPQMTFARSGFRFLNETDGNTVIPTQIAGKPSDIAPNARAISLQAIRSTDSDPAVCEPAFPDGAVRTIELAAECRKPASCAGNQVDINGNAVATNADDGSGGTVAYTPLTLTFGPAAAAPLTLAYFDAGLMQLHARFNIPLADGSNTPSGDFMLGSSNDFVVRPFGFHVEVAGNPAATDANGPVLTAAGEDFDVTVTATVWQQADDTDNNGVADGHGAADTDAGNNADLGDNAATPNFGQEAAATNVLLSPRLDQPAAGNTGILTGGTGLTGFSNGVANSTLQYTEVGIIEIRAEATDYLNGGADVTGMSGHVGRFIPFDFEVAFNSPEFATACTAGADGFTYMGQKFAYAIQPVLTVTARAKDGNTTENYAGDFFKLTEGSLTVPAPTADKGYATATGTLDLGMVPDKPAVTALSAGVGELVFSDGGGMTFIRNAPQAPFDAEISLAINVIDDDGVVYGDGSGNNLNPARFGEAAAGNGIAFSDGKEQRWGRLRLVNVSGSELLPLSMPMLTEYFDGTAFITNDDDSCTTLSLVNDIELSNPDTAGGAAQPGDTVMTVGGGGSRVTSGDPVFSTGTAAMTFSAPGEGNTGFIDVTADLAGAGFSYLLDDRDEDGDFDAADNPAGRVTFGIFRGAEEFIYTREPW